MNLTFRTIQSCASVSIFRSQPLGRSILNIAKEHSDRSPKIVEGLPSLTNLSRRLPANLGSLSDLLFSGDRAAFSSHPAERAANPADFFRTRQAFFKLFFSDSQSFVGLRQRKNNRTGG